MASATRLLDYIQKATGAVFTTTGLSGGTNGGLLANEQARQFLRDAITATVILKAGDVFDSLSPKFEVPKISFATRIMRAGTEGARLATANFAEPDTGLVTLSTALFKGEVPISDEVFEDQVERAGLADTLMEMIAQAVGRDLEQIAIQSSAADPAADFNILGNGLVQQLVASATSNKIDVSAKTTYRAVFETMVEKLPVRYRNNWAALVFYVTPTVNDGYQSTDWASRGTAGGDQVLANGVPGNEPSYRGIPVREVPLLAGTQNAVDYSKFAILCVPKNLKVGFHRRIRIEKWRDPREGATSFVPTVRFDTKWAQDSAVVLGQNVPVL